MYVRTTLTALAAAAAVGLVAASPASAASNTATLAITASSEHPGYYDVYVSGHFTTTTPSSQVGFRLIGDDPVFNDDLGVSVTATAWYGDYSMHALVWHGTLNEDWEGRDEIFARVSSSTGFRADTNNVNRSF
jgi:FlaG/FlaF family flagellin (archaellin)